MPPTYLPARTEIPVLETERLILGEPNLADAADVFGPQLGAPF